MKDTITHSVLAYMPHFYSKLVPTTTMLLGFSEPSRKCDFCVSLINLIFAACVTVTPGLYSSNTRVV